MNNCKSRKTTTSRLWFPLSVRRHRKTTITHELWFPVSVRCPKYNNVPAGCATQPDPNDPCCTMPDCPASTNYVPIPVYSKGVQSVGAVVAPNLPELFNGMFTARFTFVYDGFTVPAPTAPTGTVKPGGLGEWCVSVAVCYLCSFFGFSTWGCLWAFLCANPEAHLVLGVEVPCSAVSSHLYMPSYTRMQCYSPTLAAVSPHLYMPPYMCAVLPTPSNCNSCSCALTPVHATIHVCSVTHPLQLQLLQLCPHTCTCHHTCVQCYPPPPTATPAAVSPHLYMPPYMCAVLPTPSNCNSCSCALTPVHAVIHVCSFTPLPPLLLQLCPHTCTCYHTHVYSVTCPLQSQLLQLCPHTCTCYHTHMCSVTPPPPPPPFPHPPTPAAVSPHLYMLSYTCVQCYLPPPPLPTSPIVHALIHPGAVLPSTHTAVFWREVDQRLYEE